MDIWRQDLSDLWVGGPCLHRPTGPRTENLASTDYLVCFTAYL